MNTRSINSTKNTTIDVNKQKNGVLLYIFFCFFRSTSNTQNEIEGFYEVVCYNDSSGKVVVSEPHFSLSMTSDDRYVLINLT